MFEILIIIILVIYYLLNKEINGKILDFKFKYFFISIIFI